MSKPSSEEKEILAAFKARNLQKIEAPVARGQKTQGCGESNFQEVKNTGMRREQLSRGQKTQGCGESNFQEVKKHRDAASNFQERCSYKYQTIQSGSSVVAGQGIAEEIPYQTLVASVLHKYIDGQLVEKS